MRELVGLTIAIGSKRSHNEGHISSDVAHVPSLLFCFLQYVLSGKHSFFVFQPVDVII